METLANDMMGYLPLLFKVVLAAALAGVTVHFLTKYSSRLAVWGYWSNVIVASVIGIALFSVSAIFNMAYTESYFRDSPLIGDYLQVMVVAMGAVNLVAGLALKVFGHAYVNKNFKTARVMIVPYLIVLCYSLVAASSMLDNGLANTDHKIETTDLETQVNTIRAQELRRRASVVTTSGNPNAAALGAQKMRNSNGSRVSVSGHCKAGNWYYKNQSICRDYIAAQQNAGAQLQATNLLNEAAQLDAATVALMKDKPVRMQSRFFGYEIGDSAGSVLLALVIEMAAAVAVLFPFFIGPPPLENKRSESRSDRRPDREGLRPQSDGLGGSASEGAGGQTVNREIEVNDQIHADRAAFPHLNKVLSSYEMAFRDSERADPVTDGQLEDLISQIGLHNPHARAVANDIMRIIAHYKGVGIGKGRVLNLLASPAMSDVILIEHKGETKQYIYRDRTYVQNTQQRVGGLPNSASVGH